MKSILGERPNLKPVGIGNSASELDLDVFMSGIQDDATGLEDIEPIILSDGDEEDPQGEDQPRTHGKRSMSSAVLEEDIKPKLGTPARPNISKPSATGSKPKKVKGLEDLTEIAVAEETTRQKELDLDIQRSKEKASRAQVKAEVERAMIEAKREKAKLAHEMEIMKLQLELARTRQAALGIGTNVATQHTQDNLHPPSLYPPFGFGGDGQFGGMTGGNEGV
jgi:hypothetical protein